MSNRLNWRERFLLWILNNTAAGGFVKGEIWSDADQKIRAEIMRLNMLHERVSNLNDFTLVYLLMRRAGGKAQFDSIEMIQAPRNVELVTWVDVPTSTFNAKLRNAPWCN